MASQSKSNVRVYAAVAPDGTYKLGHSANPQNRIEKLNRRGQLRLIVVTPPYDRWKACAIERAAQQHLGLSGKQIAGEWFAATRQQIIEAIELAQSIVEGEQLDLARGAPMTRHHWCCHSIFSYRGNRKSGQA